MFPMLGIVGQAGRCGAASEPRSGGARMVRQAHQPFPRFSACRNRSQGDSSPFIKNTILFPLGWSKDPGPSLARMFLAFFVKSILHLQARALQKPLRLGHSHASMAAALALHGFAGAASEPRSGGARKTKGDPRLRGDDIRLEPGGNLPPPSCILKNLTLQLLKFDIL